MAVTTGVALSRALGIEPHSDVAFARRPDGHGSYAELCSSDSKLHDHLIQGDPPTEAMVGHHHLGRSQTEVPLARPLIRARWPEVG